MCILVDSMGRIAKISLLVMLSLVGLTARAQVFDLSFKIGKSAIDSTYKYNSRALSDISVCSGSSAANVAIYAYSSPDGSLSRNRQLASQRAQSVKSYLESRNPSNTYNIYIIEEDWESVASYLKHCKAEWAPDALEIVKTADVSKRKQLLQELWVGEAWDHLMRYCFPALRRVSVRFTAPAQETASETSALVKLVFNNSSSALKIDSKTMQVLKDLVNSGYSSVIITAYASPEGKEIYNQRLSIRRADKVKELLNSLGCNASVQFAYGGMDWDGLQHQVMNSVSVPERHQVLDVLRGGYDNQTMKKKLQQIAYGRAWLHMMENEMAPLRRVEISFK